VGTAEMCRACVHAALVAVCLLTGCGDDSSGDSGVGQPNAESDGGVTVAVQMDAAQSTEDRDAATGPDAMTGDAAADDDGFDAGDAFDPDLDAGAYEGACVNDRCFVELTEQAGLKDVVGYGRGAAFVDVDGDGWDDLFVADTDSRFAGPGYGVTALYRNLGDGTFERMDWGLHEGDLHGTWVGSFADYDNDGDPDLLIANGGYTMNSTVAFYENRVQAGGGFVNRTTESGIAAMTVGAHAWWGATWADYDGDGFLDAAITRRNGQPLLLHNEGNGTFADRAAQATVVLSLEGGDDLKNPLFFDYDGDGDQDLYIAGIGSHGLFENLGAGAFEDVTEAVLGAAVPGSAPYVFAALVEDFDQDGKEDLYLGRWDLQDILMHNLGGGVYEPLDTEIGIVTSLTNHSSPQPYENTMGLTAVDLLHDGFPDIIIGTGDPNRASYDIFYCNDGTAHFTRCSEMFDDPAAEHYLTRAHGMVTSDFDHDGDADLFRNLGGHPNHDQANPPTDSREYNKLHVAQAIDPPTAALTLEGDTSNRDAVGAHVEVTGSTTRHYRIRSTQGFQSQSSRTLTVHLGGSRAATATITWPSGMVTVVQLRQGDRVRVLEGVGIVP